MSRPDGTDERRVRQSAVQIGLWTAAGSAVVIALMVGLIITNVLTTSYPHEGPGAGYRDTHDNDHLVVDVDRVLPWVILVGVVGVLLLALVSWSAARRAVRPLGESLRTQREFIANASHELRTPLTALTSRIQILQRRLDSGRELGGTVQALRREAGVMDEVLAEMLAAADGNPIVGSCLLDEVAAETVERMSPIADDRSVRLSLEARDLLVPMAEVTLARICAALIDNALEHSPPDGEVMVRVVREGSVAVLQVEDDGPGILREDRERVFERFARGPETGRRRGFGIGLALVREAAERAGGRAVVSDSDTGATLRVDLPLV